MSIGIRAIGALAGVVLLVVSMGSAVAADRPYQEGNVTDVSSIRTEPGMFDEYMAWLAGPWKQAMEAQKAAGIIVSYGVYVTSPRGLDGPDIYLLTTYKNMAALDGLQDKLDPIYEKLQGNTAQQNQAYISRGKMRTVLGTELIREMALK